MVELSIPHTNRKTAFPPGVHLKFHFSGRKCSWERKALENIAAFYKLKVWDSFHKTTRCAFAETNINVFKHYASVKHLG